MIKQNLVIVFIIFLSSCAFNREGKRSIASVSSKIYTASLYNYCSQAGCNELKKEALGLALKRCMEEEYYKVLPSEDIKYPKKPSRSTLLGAFFLGISAKGPVNMKYLCSNSYHQATKSFPKEILFRTKTENFNSQNEFILRDGVIWFKGQKEKQVWRAVPLPDGLNTPVEIGTDAEHFVAIDRSGTILS